MASKQPKPTLSGQRIRTRKRDEKEKYEPSVFRDYIVAGLTEANNDYDAVSKFLDTANGKVDFRRYGDVLFDILFTGGHLAPGGRYVDDAVLSPISIFHSKNDADMKAMVEVINKLTRRYKFLVKQFEESVEKMVTSLKGYNDEQRDRLATGIAHLLSTQLVNATSLLALRNDYIVKEGLALEFITKVIQVWLTLSSVDNVGSQLRKAQIIDKLLEFFPSTQRTVEHLETYFNQQKLDVVVSFYKKKEAANIKADVRQLLREQLDADCTPTDLLNTVRETTSSNDVQPIEIAPILWDAILGSSETRSKADQGTEFALKFIKQYAKVIGEFTKSSKTEMNLLLYIQNFCYENIAFQKSFQKICLILYNNEVLSEETIIKWYKESHGSKGKSVFLEQMKEFIEWLQNASEEGDDDEE